MSGATEPSAHTSRRTSGWPRSSRSPTPPISRTTIAASSRVEPRCGENARRGDLGRHLLRLPAGQLPASVNPSLWRQSQLTAKQGLYEVIAGVYQIRGFDLSNMTLLEGDTGVIVIDPLISTETAAAGLALYREHRGDRPVTGVIYTHSHVDHFGGARGVIAGEDAAVGRCRCWRRADCSSTRSRRTSTPASRWRGAPRTCTARPAARTQGPDRCGPGADQPDRHHHVHPADPRDRPHRPGGDDRRRAHGIPADAGHRGALGDELLLPRPCAPCAWPRTPRTPCTTC